MASFGLEAQIKEHAVAATTICLEKFQADWSAQEAKRQEDFEARLGEVIEKRVQDALGNRLLHLQEELSQAAIASERRAEERLCTLEEKHQELRRLIEANRSFIDDSRSHEERLGLLEAQRKTQAERCVSLEDNLAVLQLSLAKMKASSASPPTVSEPPPPAPEAQAPATVLGASPETPVQPAIVPGAQLKLPVPPRQTSPRAPPEEPETLDTAELGDGREARERQEEAQAEDPVTEVSSQRRPSEEQLDRLWPTEPQGNTNRHFLVQIVSAIVLFLGITCILLFFLPYLTVGCWLALILVLFFQFGEEPSIRLVVKRAQRSRTCQQKLMHLADVLRLIKRWRSTHEREQHAKTLVYSMCLFVFMFNPDVYIIGTLFRNLEAPVALGITCCTILVTLVLVRMYVQSGMSDKFSSGLHRGDSTPRGESELVAEKAAIIQDCIQARSQHSRRAAYQQLLDIFRELDRSTLNELMEKLNRDSDSTIANVFTFMKDTKEKNARQELIEVFCFDRTRDLSVRSKSMVIHALMAMKLTSAENAEDGIINLLLSERGDDLSELKSLQDSGGNEHSMHKLLHQDIAEPRNRVSVLNHFLREGLSQVAHRELLACNHFRAMLEQGIKHNCVPEQLGFMLDPDGSSSPGGTRLTASYDGRCGHSWLKVITDMDDTLECSGGSWPAGMDERYAKHIVYPGVTAFYRELQGGPRKGAGHLVALSARPHICGSITERSVFKKFRKLMEQNTLHTMPALLTGSLDAGVNFILTKGDADGLRSLGEKKVDSFCEYIQLYPEFRFVFVGDNGQADYEVGRRISEKFPNNVEHVWMHKVQEIDKTYGWRADGEKKGVGPHIEFFDDYIIAAVQGATRHPPLISPDGLARITDAAVKDFQNIKSWPSDAARDAEKARLNLSVLVARDALESLGVSGDVEFIDGEEPKAAAASPVPNESCVQADVPEGSQEELPRSSSDQGNGMPKAPRRWGFFGAAEESEPREAKELEAARELQEGELKPEPDAAPLTFHSAASLVPASDGSDLVQPPDAELASKSVPSTEIEVPGSSWGFGLFGKRASSEPTREDLAQAETQDAQAKPEVINAEKQLAVPRKQAEAPVVKEQAPEGHPKEPHPKPQVKKEQAEKELSQKEGTTDSLVGNESFVSAGSEAGPEIAEVAAGSDAGTLRKFTRLLKFRSEEPRSSETVTPVSSPKLTPHEAPARLEAAEAHPRAQTGQVDIPKDTPGDVLVERVHESTLPKDAASVVDTEKSLPENRGVIAKLRSLGRGVSSPRRPSSPVPQPEHRPQQAASSETECKESVQESDTDKRSQRGSQEDGFATQMHADSIVLCGLEMLPEAASTIDEGRASDVAAPTEDAQGHKARTSSTGITIGELRRPSTPADPINRNRTEEPRQKTKEKRDDEQQQQQQQQQQQKQQVAQQDERGRTAAKTNNAGDRRIESSDVSMVRMRAGDIAMTRQGRSPAPDPTAGASMVTFSERMAPILEHDAGDDEAGDTMLAGNSEAAPACPVESGAGSKVKAIVQLMDNEASPPQHGKAPAAASEAA